MNRALDRLTPIAKSSGRFAAIISIASTLALATASVSAQPVTTPATVGTSETESPNRLQQMEATYQLNLRKIHSPVLQDYARRLDALQQQLQTQGRKEHSDQVSQEAQCIRQILSTTGVLPLNRPRAEIAADTALPTPADNTRPALALRAADAISPAAVSNEARKALPLGSVAWNVSKLAAGSYDVLIVFAAASLAEDEPLMLTVGSQQLVGRLPADRATGSDDSFRVFKLGNLKLPTPVADQVFTLQGGNPTIPRLRIRNVLFVRAEQG